MTTSNRMRRDPIAACISLGAVLAASILGQLATYPNLVPWYAGLTKPFTPPNWIFAPVWTALYLLMAVAFWRILRLPTSTEGRRMAIALFFSQLVLNALWSWMFFGANSTALGLVNIVPQFVLILVMTWYFFRLDRRAGWCVAPLALWVSYATVLNASLWWLNG